MSATNRGAERIASDNYPTPAWCTRRLLDTGALPLACRTESNTIRPTKWLESCAGDGAIVREVLRWMQEGNGYPEWWPEKSMYAAELREECRAPLTELCGDRVEIGDYLGGACEGFDVIITNPPFAIAELVVRKALTEADYVAVLVRQGFVGHERAAWMRKDMPDSYELPDRPSFAASVKCLGEKSRGRDGHAHDDNPPCGWGAMLPLTAERPRTCPSCGGRVRVSTSDAADYCWLVWTPERGRTAGRRVILPSTPLAERKAAA